MEVLLVVLPIAIPIIIILILGLVIFFKVRNFLRRSGASTIIRAAANHIEQNGGEIPQPVVSVSDLSAAYIPSIKRDFPQMSYELMENMAKGSICKILESIEARNTNLLDKDTFSQSLIKQVYGEIAGLGGDRKYDNIKIHKAGITSYSNQGESSRAVFEIALQYQYTGTLKTGAKVNNKLVQAGYRVTLLNNQKLYDDGETTVSANCKNCGAPLSLKGSNKFCPYCGTAFQEVADKVWQVSKYEQFA